MAANAQGTKELLLQKRVFDAVDVATTIDKDWMKFETGYFTAAGGSVGEGDYEEVPKGHSWLNNMIQRNAMCRNCGWQLGWRFEPKANSETWKAIKRADRTGEEIPEDVEPLQGPLYWSLIWRHIRHREKAGEHVPE